jgi:EAL domain-containing protein (putative c-di-GMP-specific phosphodiesterase class I)
LAQLVLENDLHHALRRNELEVHYQPQLDIKTSQIVSAEALLRWNHPKLGVLSPDTFLPLADNTGLTIPLGNWVMGQVCRQLRQWQDKGLPVKRVAVNVSAHQFKMQDLASHIQAEIDRYQLDANYLELEITEDAVMADIEQAMVIMEQLHVLGVQLAIDDFGTGYSSLNYLTKFPIHYLKIDKSFITKTPRDGSVSSIISAIVAMSHSMRLKVIAEGVETDAQLEFLNSLECDIAQGYLISKPLNAEEYMQFLLNYDTRQVAGLR